MMTFTACVVASTGNPEDPSKALLDLHSRATQEASNYKHQNDPSQICDRQSMGMPDSPKLQQSVKSVSIACSCRMSITPSLTWANYRQGIQGSSWLQVRYLHQKALCLDAACNKKQDNIDFKTMAPCQSQS